MRETVPAEIPNASPISLHRAPASSNPLICATWVSVTLAFGLVSPRECTEIFARVAWDSDLPLLASPTARKRSRISWVISRLAQLFCRSYSAG